MPNSGIEELGRVFPFRLSSSLLCAEEESDGERENSDWEERSSENGGEMELGSSGRASDRR